MELTLLLLLVLVPPSTAILAESAGLVALACLYEVWLWTNLLDLAIGGEL